MNQVAQFPSYSAHSLQNNDDTIHSVEAEQQVLGALLSNNELLDKISGFLEQHHFFESIHAEIFEKISSLVMGGHLASPVTLKESFKTHEGLKELGGIGYLVKLQGAAIMPGQTCHYANYVVEMYERRRLLKLTTDSTQKLRDGVSSEDVVQSLEAEMLQSSGSSANPRSMSLLAASTKSIQEMNDRYQNGSTGVPSGLHSLDDITGGFHRAEFSIIGGATSMGKTALGTWIAYVAARQGVGVGFVTLEMGESQLYQRINSIDSKVPYQDQRRDLSEESFRKVIAAVQNQKELPIELFNAKTRSVHGIFAEARKLQRKWASFPDFKGLGMLVIDYIQLIKGSGTSLEVLAEAAIECKNIAKRLDIPVVALAQVNRSIAQRDNKVPTLADLRGAGDLEFAADNVIFCHRPEYYLTRELQNSNISPGDYADIERALSICQGTMDLYVAKQRMGEIGQCRVGCDMGTNRFWNI